MAYDGAGNYSLPAGSDVATGDTILATDLNTPLDDVEAALSQVLLRSGVAPMTGDLDLGGFDVVNAGGAGGTFLTEDDIGTSGHKIPQLDVANTWTASQTFSHSVAMTAGGTLGDESADTVVIKGSTVSSYSPQLLALASASAWRSSLDLGTEDSPQFTGLTVGTVSVTGAITIPVASVAAMLNSLPDGGAISITGGGTGSVFIVRTSGGVWQRRTNSSP